METVALNLSRLSWTGMYSPRSWNVFTTYKAEKGEILSLLETTWSNAAKLGPEEWYDHAA
jgi:hypothetical protein